MLERFIEAAASKGENKLLSRLSDLADRGSPPAIAKPIFVEGESCSGLLCHDFANVGFAQAERVCQHAGAKNIDEPVDQTAQLRVEMSERVVKARGGLERKVEVSTSGQGKGHLVHGWDCVAIDSPAP